MNAIRASAAYLEVKGRKEEALKEEGWLTPDAKTAKGEVLQPDAGVGEAGGADRGNLLIAGSEPTVTGCEIGWSSNYCVWLLESELGPDSLRERNWLHDWAPEFEDIFEDGR